MYIRNKFNKVPPTFGVGEWAGYSYNCGIGCSHNCRYCYARSFFTQEGIVASDADWVIERPMRNKISINQKADKRVMFPSTHDISPAYLDTYCQTLRNILAAGNDVLLVSKPHFECIETICNEFTAFRNQMEFRFTIGSLDPAITGFWEPGAPSPTERMRCLEHATNNGYQTSISMEPILEGKEAAIQAFYELAPLTNGTIWIGRINDIGKRITADSDEAIQAVAQIRIMQSDAEMRDLYSLLHHEPKVKWKDSIRVLVR